MRKPPIVVVGHAEDEHSDFIEKLLIDRDRRPVVRVSLSDLPGREFSWEPSGCLRFGEVTLRPGECGGVWRRSGAADVDGFQERFSAFIEDECKDAFQGALMSLDIDWLTHPGNLTNAELKLVQLRTAALLGIAIPRTIVTNSGRSAAAFLSQQGQGVVKPVRYGLVSVEPEPLVAFTAEIQGDELATLDGPPLILQERVEAAEHLRVVTVDGEAFIARLSASELDWRSKASNHSRFRPASWGEFPIVSVASLRLARALRLGFSAQDWMASKRGDLIFLEANPNGQWLFLNDVFGGAIGDALARRLESLGQLK